MGIKEFNEKHDFVLTLIEKGELDKAKLEFPKLVGIYNQNKRNDLYFKLKKVHKSLSTYSLIKKVYEMK
ncbi:MAG: hypothetical protein Q8N88_04845 [Nanoarchaeota archaeon]|nr:hypothetical protein [Nanoarchaeota archaeon]